MLPIFTPHLSVAIDAGDERVEDDEFVVLFGENEAQESRHQRRFGDRAQKQVQVRSRGRNFLQRVLRRRGRGIQT